MKRFVASGIILFLCFFLSVFLFSKFEKKRIAQQQETIFCNAKKRKLQKEEKNFIVELKKRINIGNVPSWLNEQIQSDLSPFRESGITSQMLDTCFQRAQIYEQLGMDLALARYVIKKNRVQLVHIPQKWQQDKRLESMTAALKTLCCYIDVPDVDLIITLHDALDGVDLGGPVCAFAKNIHSDHIVLIPDFEALTGNFVFLKEVKQGKEKYSWDQKIPQVFWRGASTGGVVTITNFSELPRSSAIRFSLGFPALVNARFTSLVQCIEPMSIKEKFADYFGEVVSVRDHLKYKYQLLIDGNTCAYSRAYWQLFSDSVILKQQSDNTQWYYRALVPCVHYIPLNHALDDLIEKVQWAISHDDDAKTISLNAQRFANENLTLPDIYYHLYLILKEISKLQK